MVSAIVCRGDGVLRTEMLALLSLRNRRAFVNRVCLLVAVMGIRRCCGANDALQRLLCVELDSRKVGYRQLPSDLTLAGEPCFELWDSSHVPQLWRRRLVSLDDACATRTSQNQLMASAARMAA